MRHECSLDEDLELLKATDICMKDQTPYNYCRNDMTKL